MMRNARLAAALAFLLIANITPGQDSDDGDAVRSGEFQLTFTVTEVAGPDAANAVESFIALDELITWEVYVPDGYQSDKPAGLMVYISPSMSGKIPRGWKSVLDRHNIIWIAANRSGNRAKAARRAVFAVIAPTLASKHYAIDAERVYLSGLSGGGRMAGMVAADNSRLFKGAIYNCGIDSLDKHPPRQLDLFKQNHFVFVTGTLDHMLEQTKEVHKQYLQSGIENSKLMVIRNMTHGNPRGADFDKAIQYLDLRIKHEAP